VLSRRRPVIVRDTELCRAAGADEAAIGQWIAVGRQRAGQAWQQPYAGQP
jgi:hypothetical protein